MFNFSAPTVNLMRLRPIFSCRYIFIHKNNKIKTGTFLLDKHHFMSIRCQMQILRREKETLKLTRDGNGQPNDICVFLWKKELLY